MLTTSLEPAHVVQFYENDDFLFDVVTEFLEPGFAAKVPMVVVATPAHRRAISEALSMRGHDVAAAQASGLLTMNDARETLSRFMVAGVPDRELFRRNIGSMVEASVAKSPTGQLRAYGEMVDLLWRDENGPAAIALEELWNDLAREHTFTLLCTYGMSGFPRGEHRHDFQAICDTHTHVRPTERYPARGESEARLRELTLLEQRALALEHELSVRDRTEATLRATEQNLSDFLENAAEGIHAVGPDGVITWANRAELELLGYGKDEYVGHHISKLHADRKSLDALLVRLGRGETVINHEARLKCRDGSVKDVLITSNALMKDGKLVHTRCFTRDVTQQKDLQRQLEARNQELAHSVRSADQFVNVLGHDLRNPLSAIMTAAGLMRRRSTDESITKPADRILSSADRMARMVDQLLDFARARLGKGLELERGPADLSEVCRMVLDETSSERTVMDVRGDTTGTWDVERLAQLVRTLLGNALTHGASGTSVALDVDGTDAHCVTLTMANRGTIPPEVLPDLFEPRDWKRDGAKALGLGLYVCRQIALAHQGTLEVQSDDAAGTRFALKLPRKG